MINRASRRKKNFHKAKHKQYIAKHCCGWESYDNLHQYSKNKIHCSCAMCTGKTNDNHNKSKGRVDENRGSCKLAGTHHRMGKKNWKPSDIRKIKELEEKLNEYNCDVV